MIDYLEALFAPEGGAQKGEEELLLRRGASLPGEQAAEMSLPVPEEEPPVFRALTRPDREPVQTGERSGFLSLRRPEPVREAEEVQRRLERESRRYDCGFYQF